MENSKTKVLVTGADGFIGSHLTEMLLDEGYAVRALSQYNSFNNWGWLEEISHPDLEVVTGDVRDPNFCRHITEGCDTVYHLAALIAIPYSYVAPDSYVDTNIKGTLNMCQAARDCGVRRIVVTSTSEVYGTAKYVPIDESHPRQPQSPYIIPTIITQIASGAREIKVGDLTPTRDFNFVKDTAAGFIALGRAEGIEGREINIATGSEVTMRETLETIARIMGEKVDYVTDPQRLRPSGSEVFRLCGDNSLIKSLTDWRPRYDLEAGLRETVEWFTKGDNLSKYKSGIYNV